jgi:hypothetical protein
MITPIVDITGRGWTIGLRFAKPLSGESCFEVRIPRSPLHPLFQSEY